MRDIKTIKYPEHDDYKGETEMLVDLAEYIGISKEEMSKFWLSMPISLRMSTEPGTNVEPMFQSVRAMHESFKGK
jgi:hypothetical protein